MAEARPAHRGRRDGVVNPGRLTPELLTLVAERFKALSEPARLALLAALRVREATVGELVERVDLSQANVSKHLRLLHAMGFVTRRKDGLFVYYALADRHVFELCDIICGRLEHQARARRKVLAV